MEVEACPVWGRTLHHQSLRCAIKKGVGRVFDLDAEIWYVK